MCKYNLKKQLKQEEQDEGICTCQEDEKPQAQAYSDSSGEWDVNFGLSISNLVRATILLCTRPEG